MRVLAGFSAHRRGGAKTRRDKEGGMWAEKWVRLFGRGEAAVDVSGCQAKSEG